MILDFLKEVTYVGVPGPNVGTVPAKVKEGKVHLNEAVPGNLIFGCPAKSFISVPDPELPGICVSQLFPLKLTVPKSVTYRGDGLNKVSADGNYSQVKVLSQ